MVLESRCLLKINICPLYKANIVPQKGWCMNMQLKQQDKPFMGDWCGLGVDDALPRYVKQLTIIVSCLCHLAYR